MRISRSRIRSGAGLELEPVISGSRFLVRVFILGFEPKRIRVAWKYPFDGWSVGLRCLCPLILKTDGGNSELRFGGQPGRASFAGLPRARNTVSTAAKRRGSGGWGGGDWWAVTLRVPNGGGRRSPSRLQRYLRPRLCHAVTLSLYLTRNWIGSPKVYDRAFNPVSFSVRRLDDRNLGFQLVVVFIDMQFFSGGKGTGCWKMRFGSCRSPWNRHWGNAPPRGEVGFEHSRSIREVLLFMNVVLLLRIAFSVRPAFPIILLFIMNCFSSFSIRQTLP